MNDDVLGLNHLLSFPATCHTVRPPSSALSSGHLRMAPPKSSSGMPRCFRYHAASAALSPVLLKNTPPTPVILAMSPFLLAIGGGRSGASCHAPREPPEHERYDQQQCDVADKMCVLLGCSPRLHGHDSRVGHARPDGEPDQTQVAKRLTRRSE